MARIGILGGTFDPPHNGHLLLAECARHQLGLAQVRLMPAGEPYQKAGASPTDAATRLEMVRLAVEGNGGLAADPREVERAGPTYTVETLRELAAEGIERPVFILGADALGGLASWREHEHLEQLAELVVAPKGWVPAQIATMAAEAGLAQPPSIIHMPPVAISSTLIRNRVAAGLPVRYLLPDAVWRYVDSAGLYRRGYPFR